MKGVVKAGFLREARDRIMVDRPDLGLQFLRLDRLPERVRLGRAAACHPAVVDEAFTWNLVATFISAWV
jgi:hypothetical protein